MNENTINFLNNIDFENTDNVYHIIETLYEENKKHKEVIDKVVKYIEKNMNQQLYTGKEMFRSYSPATDLLNILEEVK